MAASDVKRVALTGAAGQIAYSLIPHLCNGSIFGTDVKVILQLLDIPGTESVLEGVHMEIEDAAYPCVAGVVVTSDMRVAFQKADYAVLLGGFPRKPGMERRDLLAKNVEIISAHAGAINDVASPNVKVVVVANPANTLALVALKAAPRIPPANFTSLTRLDQDRLRGQLAKKLSEQRGPGLEVVPTRVRNAVIWGNHSATQVPSADHAEVRFEGAEGWVGVKEALKDTHWVEQEMVGVVQQRGAAVLAARKLSSALSAAAAIANHLRSWVQGTAEGEFVSMGVLSTGNGYEVPDDIIFSLPVTCAKGEWRIVEGLKVAPKTRELFPATVEELLEEKGQALSRSHL